MKAMVLESFGVENLRLEDLPEPEPAAGEVLVRLRAASLNYRDLLLLDGGYGARQKSSRLIPLSDGAGEVVAVGSDVREWKPGDRVAGCFYPEWQTGPPREADLQSDPGRMMDGMAVQYRVFHEKALVAIPSSFGFVEAASLPCAAVTAWNAVRVQAEIGPEHVVLTQGTGGVSLFAVQFAGIAGAEIVATSSSPAKLDRLKALGAHHVIDYQADPAWGKTARGITGDRGVDLVVEIGGAGTLKQSLRALRTGGLIALIGVVSGSATDLNLPLIFFSSARLHGVSVGSRAHFVDMLAAMDRHGVKPVIDSAFPLPELAAACAHLKSGRHIGKVCIEID